MDYNPKKFPLFGGQKIIFKFETNLIEKLSTNKKEKIKIYVEFYGKLTCHLINLIPEEENFFCFVPANDCIEEKKIKLFLVDKTTGDSEEIQDIPTDLTIEFIDDGFIECLKDIDQNLHSFEDMAKCINTLHTMNYSFIENDETIENFDIKLSKFLSEKFSKNQEIKEKIKVYENELIKLLERKCLNNSKQYIKAFLSDQLSDIGDSNFIYEINEHNAESTFSDVLFFKDFSNCGIVCLSYTKFIQNFEINEQIYLLHKFIDEFYGSHTEELKNNDIYKSRTKSICHKYNSLDKSTQIKLEDTEIEQPAVISENKEKSPQTKIIKKEKIQKSSTFKRIVDKSPDKVALPSRSSSDKFSSKKVPSLDLSKNKNTPESGVSLEIPKDKKLFSRSSSPEGSSDEQSLSVERRESDVSSNKSISSDDQLLSINEFIQKQFDRVNKDTHLNFVKKQLPIESNEKLKNKKAFAVLSHIFKKEKKNDKNVTMPKSNTRINLNKNLCASNLDVKSNDSQGSPITSSQNNSQNSVSRSNDVSVTNDIFLIEEWSKIVDKSVTSKLSQKEIKRQNVIYELIRSENNFWKTLRTMYELYHKGLKTQLHVSTQKVDILLPRITELSAIHGAISATMTQAFNKSENFVIDSIGDALLYQFTDPIASKLIETYSYVISIQQDSSDCFKELNNDKRCKQYFDAIYNTDKNLRKLDIPGCQSLIYGRMTKYPSWIQRILENTDKSTKDYEKLTQALKLSKEVLQSIDFSVNNLGNLKILQSLRMKIDTKNEFINKNNERIKLADVLNNVQLLNASNARLKTKKMNYDISIVCLNKYILLLTEINGKISFINVEKKNPILNYKEIVVRVLACETKSLYFMAEKDMDYYEIEFTSDKESSNWLLLYNKYRTDYEQYDAAMYHDNMKESIKEFLKMLETGLEDAEKILGYHKALINELKSLQSHLKKKYAKNENKRLSARLSLVDENWWEKTIMNELSDLLKNSFLSSETPVMETQRTGSGYRPRTRTLNILSNSAPTSPAGSMSKDRSSKLTLKIQNKESFNFSMKISEISSLIETEEYFSRLIKTKLTTIDSKRSVDPIIEKHFNEISLHNKELLTSVQLFKKSLLKLTKSNDNVTEKMSKAEKSTANDIICLIKTKLDELTAKK